MGSGQSRAANDDGEKSFSSTASHTPEIISSSSSQDLSSQPINTKGNAKPNPPKNESGPARAERICRKKKRAYDACYTAQLSSKEEDCSDLFESYKTCFLRVMTKDMEKRGVKVSENSMIGEYKEEIADEEE
mmetsp:Transcript_20059/g.43506  ORF Transcript_20059/g.43506 Transcript_20059/m.43506 type:complete len:132 (-) Transcript_20059:268-663(-)|eukprot:CAMPEP_0172316270 /NCGR_PEP_ID=MMETSP1058-20130122/27647_1 /TAXON_ID=83371 /ORGANISM="Detonula confervacea, Strain CCMP 353" /LENGTH=131 /DNA_ID=CAMNT_0013030541 /DNA_START=133 /DNA_END=528 /DNA_ORIENTATION=+